MRYFLKNVSLFILIITLFSLSWPIYADGPKAQLYLQRASFQDDKLLLVNVELKNVVDLYGAEIQLRFDPTRLAVRDADPNLDGVQILPGPLLPRDKRLGAINNVETEVGVIKFAITLLNPAPPVSGDGALAGILFEVLGNGPISVTVVNAKLVSANLTQLPVVSYDLYLESTAPLNSGSEWPTTVPSTTWPWWSVLVLFGGGVIALVYVMSWYRSRQSEPITASPMPRKMPGVVFSASRSSSLLTRQGHEAMKQDNIQRAYELFSQAIELDPANAESWLGKGLVAQQESEKRICYQRALSLDPDNATAKAALEKK